MMQIYINGLCSDYETQHVARMFFTKLQITNKYPCSKNYNNAIVVHVTKSKIFCAIRLMGKSQFTLLKINMLNNNQFICSPKIDSNASLPEQKLTLKKKNTEYNTCVQLYNLLCNVTGIHPPWGMLTGVRPVRLIHDMRKQNYTDKQIKKRFCTDFFATEGKFNLALKTADIQKKYIELSNSIKRPYSLYISIPFCPTKCSYCSFVSTPTAQTKALIQPYLQKLHSELKHISLLAQKNNLTLVSIYIGGGTPTALSEIQLEELMICVKNYFDISKVYEYTVEAGRPDCTNAEKLFIMKKHGATRISINPQTFNDEVLKNIGRKHTGNEIVQCFELARKEGHDNINADLIAGLPGDNLNSFKHSLNCLINLNAQNVTVHTLALKRASNITVKNEAGVSSGDVNADITTNHLPQMISEAESILCADGVDYAPYYLYRQKNTPGNLENTGYTKSGYEGLYNIFIMEELHTILSAGAGGSTKLVNSTTGHIARIFNHKYPTEYIQRFDTVLQRKEGVCDFYGK